MVADAQAGLHALEDTDQLLREQEYVQALIDELVYAFSIQYSVFSQLYPTDK